MSEFVVRPVREDELDAVGEVTVRAYKADGYFAGNDNYRPELADATTRFQESELVVAVDSDGTVLGTVTIAFPGTKYAEISRDGELEFRMLAVDPAARRRGVGEALIRAVIERAREAGLPRVVMCSQSGMTGVHRIYERIGFRRLPERDWKPREDVLLIGFELDL
jgi:ribosomal protein S18 acetylase RimI-like enzyme